MKKKILIVAYSMPPSGDIGGRRWVKFAKYLKRNGHLVKIIAAKENFSGISPWMQDGLELKENITFINSSYPEYLGINARTFTEKIFYRASRIYALSLKNGNYYDKSNFWENSLLNSCRDKIKESDIDNLICTIPPFRSAFFLLKLKKEFPKLNFVVDYRDPWSENKTSFGFENLNKKRFAFEKKLENSVVNGYDKIITVSTEMKDNFKEFLNGNLENKVTVIPNGFDRDDLKNISILSNYNKSSELIKIVFTGTFYDKSVHVFEKLVEVIKTVESNFPNKKGFVKFVFIGSIPIKVKELIDNNAHCFSFEGRKSLSQTYEIIASSNFCSLFLSDDLNYSLSTKFYEYIALNKPILSFSKIKGANAKFIEENQLGMGIDFESMYDFINKLFNNQMPIEYKPKINIEEFEIKNLVKQLEKIIV